MLWLRQPWLVTDSADYVKMASGDFSQGVLRVPAYPLFLAALGALPAGGIIAIQLALYLVSVCLFDRFVFKSDAFLPVAAVYIFPLFYVAVVASEALAILFIAVALASVRKPPFSGLAVGLAVLTRPDHLPAAVALPAIVWALDRKTLQRPVLIIAGTCAALLPYMAWNKANFGSFSPLPVSSVAGLSLYIATWEGHVGYDELQVIIAHAKPTQKAIDSGLVAEHSAILAKGGTDKQFRDAALKRMRVEPELAVWHSVKGIWRLFNTQRYPAPPIIALGLSIVSSAVWLLGMIGMLLFARGRLLIPAAVFWAVLIAHLPLHTEARYTASLRLILVGFAALVISGLLSAIARSTTRRGGCLALFAPASDSAR